MNIQPTLTKKGSDFSKLSPFIQFACNFPYVLPSITFIVFAFSAPPSHNPDANLYFGVATRLARGNFWGSIDLLYSPLLSWLMALPMAFGLPALIAYRLLNCVFALLCFYKSDQLAKDIDLSPLHRTTLGLALSIVILVPGLFVVTSDLAGAAIFLLLVGKYLDWQHAPSRRSTLQLSVLLGLLYYAKAFLFLVAITAFMVDLACRHKFDSKNVPKFALVIFYASALVSPWILLIWVKFGVLTFSGQSLLFYGGLGFSDYHPDLKVAIQLTDQAKRAPVCSGSGHLMCSVSYFLERVPWQAQRSVEMLVPSLLTQYFGTSSALALAVLLVLLAVTAMPPIQTSAVARTYLRITGTYVVVHLITWGGHPRYFIAAICLSFICAVYALKLIQPSFLAMFTGIRRRAASFVMNVLMACLLVDLMYPSIQTIQSQWRLLDPDVIAYAETRLSTLPHFIERGIVTGALNDPYSGLLAYSEGNEFWSPLDPNRDTDSRSLSLKLDLWNIQSIYWFGSEFPTLDSLSYFTKYGPYEAKNVHFSIYLRK